MWAVYAWSMNRPPRSTLSKVLDPYWSSCPQRVTHHAISPNRSHQIENTTYFLQTIGQFKNHENSLRSSQSHTSPPLPSYFLYLAIAEPAKRNTFWWGQNSHTFSFGPFPRICPHYSGIRDACLVARFPIGKGKVPGSIPGFATSIFRFLGSLDCQKKNNKQFAGFEPGTILADLMSFRPFRQNLVNLTLFSS